MPRWLASLLGVVGIVAGCIAAQLGLEALTGWDLEWEVAWVGGALSASWLDRGSIPWRRAERIREASNNINTILSKYDNEGGQ
jgi:hypothetical protein